VINWSFYYL